MNGDSLFFSSQSSEGRISEGKKKGGEKKKAQKNLRSLSPPPFLSSHSGQEEV